MLCSGAEPPYYSSDSDFSSSSSFSEGVIVVFTIDAPSAKPHHDNSGGGSRINRYVRNGSADQRALVRDYHNIIVVGRGGDGAELARLIRQAVAEHALDRASLRLILRRLDSLPNPPSVTDTIWCVAFHSSEGSIMTAPITKSPSRSFMPRTRVPSVRSR